MGLAGCASLAIVLLGRSTDPLRRSDSDAIRRACAACHAYPDPELLPSDAWLEQVRGMYDIARQDRAAFAATLPPMAAVLRFYTERAPERLAIRQETGPILAGGAEFEQSSIRHLGGDAQFAHVTHVQFAQLTPGGPIELVACDGRHGLVLAADPSHPDRVRVLGAVPEPVHVEVVDLDRDGITDLVVASLGDFAPTDAKNGAVYWLKGQKGGGYRTIPLLTELGRVADVRAADLDGDGDIDLVIAEFGFHKVGGILYAENVTSNEDVPVFELHRIDSRPGPVHVPIVDLDGDGRPDIVALVSQEFESVIAFLNNGGGSFTPKTLFEAHNPAWGASGLQVVDLDGDGDLDILVTNGDTFDNFVLKPYHGIGWLENQGNMTFVYHRLAEMPAVYSARAGDLDGDGDLDIVACSFYAPRDPQGSAPLESLSSVIWLEQTAPGQFERHELERGLLVHPSLDVADFDGDGFADVALAVWPSGPYQRDSAKIWDWVTLLRNKGR